MENVTVSIVLLKRSLMKKESASKGENVYPVKLRITYDGNQRYYSANASMTGKEFTKARLTKRRPLDFDKHFNAFNKIEERTKRIIDQMQYFSFAEFNEWYNSDRNIKNVFDCFDEYQSELIKNNQASTASVYKDAENSFKRFIKTRSIREGEFTFKRITVKWLKSYQAYMEDLGRTNTTIGMYLRPLRTIVNRYSNQDVKAYPFGKDKYEIPSGTGRKVFLEQNEIEKIFKYEPKTKLEQKALDIFKFSFFCNGLNIADMLTLKKSNIDLDAGKIHFVRQKTKRTSKNQILISVNIGVFTRKFIMAYQDHTTKYLFPFIDSELKPEIWLKRKRDFIGTINANLKHIAKSVGVAKNVTSYTARHTFATQLVRDEISLLEIQKRLGHKNITTTENYLHGMGSKVEKKADEAIGKYEQFA